jgi:hypothetical protein
VFTRVQLWLVSICLRPMNNISSSGIRPNLAWNVQGTDANIFQGHPVSGGGSGQLSLPYLVTLSSLLHGDLRMTTL